MEDKCSDCGSEVELEQTSEGVLCWDCIDGKHSNQDGFYIITKG